MIIIGGILQENSFFVPPDEGNRRTRLVSAQTESRRWTPAISNTQKSALVS